MNLIFAKHEGNPKAFCFSVPDVMAKHIVKGMDILVDTMHGPAMAHTTTGVISGDGALDVARQSGAYEPIKSVLSFISPGMYLMIRAKVVKQVMATLGVAELPY